MDNYGFDLCLIFVFGLVQWRITRLLLAAYPRPWMRPALLLLDAFLAISYSFTFSIVAARLHLASRWTMTLGAAALAYFMTATAVLGLYYVLRALHRHLGAETNPGRRRVLNAAGNAILASPFGVIGYGALVQRTDFRVREIDIALPGLPHDLDGLRLLQLSDIHLSAFLSEAELARVIDASNELRANLAFITGDLISGHSDPLDACIRQVARVKSDAGILGCMGNHERYIKAEDYTQRAAAKLGIRFLRREACQVRFGSATLNIAGSDFESHRNRKNYLAGMESLVQPGAVNLLLQHSPDVFPAAAAKGYNFLLAGHTHGGQVTVEILDQSINPARFFTPYVYGLYRIGASSAYVTRGIGTIGIPARIGAPPEISLLRLRKA
ncbi:MAG TPA: metallophosphoesterase [Candidatus Acidoferrales bacterium]|nr:metallophosphoesterase [Candidatus Acidoferrales bacterium]